jgi:hypothetical protein
VSVTGYYDGDTRDISDTREASTATVAQVATVAVANHLLAEEARANDAKDQIRNATSWLQPN